MNIQRLRINSWEVHNCDEIVKFATPDAAEPFWVFYYENGDHLVATGQISFLTKVDDKNVVDTLNPT